MALFKYQMCIIEDYFLGISSEADTAGKNHAFHCIKEGYPA